MNGRFNRRESTLAEAMERSRQVLERASKLRAQVQDMLDDDRHQRRERKDPDLTEAADPRFR